MWVIFDMLISLFERAYLLVWEPDMSEKQLRRWHSWEDYMREWCRREDFRAALPACRRRLRRAAVLCRTPRPRRAPLPDSPGKMQP